MYTNWEQDENGKGCPVPDEPVTSPVSDDCTLGGMASYVINATTADQIADAVKFAATWNLRLRIKNSGHDYTGRSSGAGAFSIWTRYMNDAKLVKGFKPCDSSAAHDVLLAGPGVDVEELFAAGGRNGVATIGGFTTTVGATGGYILGGGTGPLGPFLGLGVDNVLQYDVVLADGTQTFANECHNEDLFWAMRGGGGAFGVTTGVYLKAYPAFGAVNTVSGSIGCANYSAYSELITRLVDIQPRIRDQGHAGIWEASGAQLGLALLSVKPLKSAPFENAKDTLAEYADVIATPGCKSTIQGYQFTGSDSWNQAYQAVIWPIVREGSAVGINLADFSRLISYDMINKTAAMQQVKQYILDLPAKIPFIWQNAVGGAVSEVAPEKTSVHPDWRKAFAFIDVPVFGPWEGVTPDQDQEWLQVRDNATQVFGATAYYNEDYIYEKDWQASMFGGQYEKLLAIKETVDPDRVFNCRQCVGSERGF
jgi:hypothetical protein